MAKHVGLKLPEDLLQLLKTENVVAVLATFSESGLPHTTPIQCLYPKGVNSILFSIHKDHIGYHNMVWQKKVMFCIMGEGNIAYSILGREFIRSVLFIRLSLKKLNVYWITAFDQRLHVDLDSILILFNSLSIFHRISGIITHLLHIPRRSCYNFCCNHLICITKKILMLIDTHIHLDIMLARETSNNAVRNADLDTIRSIVNEACVHDVTQFITIGTTVTESYNAYFIATNIAQVYAAIGIHPTEWKSNWKDDLHELKKILAQDRSRRVVAIGECGIDRYRTTVPVSEQRDLFRAQIDLALEHNLPIVIHSRDAADETLTCLDEYRDAPLRGVMHCFSYDLAYAREIIARKFVLGIGGTVTYPKNEILRTVVKEIPLEHIVLETDGPFLPPQPWRGTQNHPKYIAYIAEYIAELRQITYISVAQKTTETAHILFQM